MVRTKARRRVGSHAKSILLAAALAGAQQASGGLTFDLRFTDGTHTQVATAGSAYTLELWAKVTGTDGTNLNEGIQSALITVMSTQLGGGAITFGGLSGASVATDFQSYSGTTPLYRNGTGSDLNGDGMGDWGSTSTALSNSSYMFARAGGIMTGPSVGQALSSNAWEFRLASFTVNAGSTGTGVTNFNVVKPSATSVPVAATYAFARVDGVAFNISQSNQQGAYSGSTGVTFLSSGSSPPPGPTAWDGGPLGTGTEWTIPANWNVDINTATEHVPGASDTANFGTAGAASVIGIDMGGATNNGPAHQIVGSVALVSGLGMDITVQNSSSTNGILTLNSVGGVLISNTNANRTLTIQNGNSGSLGIELAQSGTIFVGAFSTISISSAISGSGASVNKSGVGTLNLTGVNSYTGSTTVSSGLLNIAAGGSIASPFVTVASGAVMNVAGSLSPTTVLTIDGSASLSNTSQSVDFLNGGGALNLQSTALSMNQGNMSGPITGDGSLNKTSTGTFTLGGTNSYSGGTTVSSGTLLGSTNSIQGNIGNSGTVTFDQTFNGAYAGAITGSGKVIKTNTGTVVLTGPNNFLGGTTISGGTVQTSSNSLQGGVTLSSGTLAFDQATDGTFIGNITGGGAVTKQGAGRLVLLGNNTSAYNTIVSAGILQGNTSSLKSSILDNANVTFDQAFDGTYSGVISGSGSVSKSGPGTVTFGNTSYSGETFVSGGRLIVSNTSSSSFRAASGGVLRLTGAAAVMMNGNLKADVGGTIEYVDLSINGGFLRGPGTHTLLGSNNSLGNATLFSGAQLQQNAPATLINIISSGKIFNNAALTWDGGSIGAAGGLTVNNTANISSVDSVGVITVNNGGTLNNSDTLLVVGGGSRTTVNPGGNLNLLNGTSLDVSGGLLVNNGVITGDINGYYGSLTKGAGTFNGAVNLFDGARFSPGNSPGSATVGSFTFGAGGNYLFEVADATGAPGFGSDFLNVVNSLTVAAGSTANSRFLISIASLDQFNNPAAPLNFDSSQEYHWTLAHAGAGISGFSPSLFAIDSSGFLAPTGGGSFNVSEAGNDLLLNFNPVPEPGSAVAIGTVALGGLLGRRRRVR
jgi:autotransporter-associated beta strand protein